MLPSVCVIIPTYNQAAFIKRAVGSVLTQSYPNLQVVVADDGSTDDTQGVLQTHIRDRKIEYHCSPANLGRVRNYRRALHDYTTAAWVINLDGDDFFTNNEFIAEAVKAIQKRGESQVLFYQGAHEVRGDQADAVKSPEPIERGTETVLRAGDYFFGFFDRRSFSHLTTLYRRDLALASGFYEFDTLSSDLYSVLKLCLNNPDMDVVLSKKKSAVWYQHAANTSKSVSGRVHTKNLRLLSGLARLAQARRQGWARCVIWQIRLTLFYGLLYAGALRRKGLAALKRSSGLGT
jgi:glycosyltransferase involved in cell wall biosynthesis